MKYTPTTKTVQVGLDIHLSEEEIRSLYQGMRGGKGQCGVVYDQFVEGLRLNLIQIEKDK